MANGGTKNDNGSQFFITLGKTEELNGRNTLFGRVAVGRDEGDTIFNVLRIGEAELVEGSDRPLYPVRIEGVEVLVNPFEDMKASSIPYGSIGDGNVGKGQREENEERKKRKVATKGKNKRGGKTLLSFGVDEGEDGGEEVVSTKRVKYNPKIVRGGDKEGPVMEEQSSESEEKKQKQPSGSSRLVKERQKSPPPPSTTKDVKQQRREHQETTPESTAAASVRGVARARSSPSTSPEPAPPSKSRLDRTNAQIADLKASMRRGTNTTLDPPSSSSTKHKKSAVEAMIPKTSIRGRKRRGGAASSNTSRASGANGINGATGDNDDRKALKMLNAFKSRLDRDSSSLFLNSSSSEARIHHSPNEKKSSVVEHVGNGIGSEDPIGTGKGKQKEVVQHHHRHQNHQDHSRSHSHSDAGPQSHSERRDSQQPDSQTLNNHSNPTRRKKEMMSSRSLDEQTHSSSSDGIHQGKRDDDRGRSHEKKRSVDGGGGGSGDGDEKKTQGVLGRKESNSEDEEETCDLHFVIDCPSCRSWERKEKGERGRISS